MTLALEGTPPCSSTKLTVEPATNPVPVMVTGVPPVMGPAVPLRLETAGTTGAHTQLSTVMVVPQYTTHRAVVGTLIPGG
jgi:hypothetical protein